MANYVVGHNNSKNSKVLQDPKLKSQQQVSNVEDFRSNRFNVLVSTSLCEEGIDIPDCNLVVSFQEPLSITGLIQAKGRARRPDSQYFILVPEGRVHFALDKLISTI